MKHAIPLIAIVVLVAGCLSESGGPTGSTLSSSQGAASTVSPTPADPGAPPAPTSETGSVLVTVTDPELVPIEAAQVELVGADLRASSDASGQATFNGIIPGAYTVLVAKPGYTAQHDKGKAIDVKAEETTDVKMVMNPIVLVDASNSYHTVLPFKGFMSCGFEGAPGMVLGRNSACGQWLNPGGVSIGDPNHKTRFTWSIDSTQISAIVVDSKWTPTTGVTGQQLRFVVTHKIECAATCLWQDTALNVGGPSPVHGVLLQGQDNRITKKWGEDPKTYPKVAYFETGAYCQTNCVGVQVVLQQGFEKWLTAFYGAEPAVDYTALPK